MTTPDYVAIEARARQVRERLRLGTGPAPDILSVLTDAGLTVIVQPLGLKGPDGLYVRRPRIAVALLNGSKYLPRFRFTGAHELGHHEFGEQRAVDRDIFVAATFEEKQANAFAACFLVPKSAIAGRVEFKSDIAPERVLQLANEFGVSYETMVYRLHNVGWLKGGAGRRDALLASRAAVLTDSLRNRRVTRDTVLPLDFVKRAVAAYSSQSISLGRFAELLGMDEADARKGLADLGLLHDEDA
jgi:Zn-dependent peptidase ImmA (M78 family)